MGRALLALLSVLAGSAALAARNGSPDPVFATIPFDQWFQGGQQARFKWTNRVFATGLTNHQRLGVRVLVELDGVELVKRRGKGDLLVLVQFQDKEGRVYQSHHALPLDDVKDEASRNLVQFIQDAFVTPGDYQVSVAIYATGTNEHASARRAIHVDPLARDPLPDLWRDLPAVEFLTGEDPPDTWWNPSIEGRLNLPLETTHAVRIELLVNESATEQATGTRFGRTSGRNMAALLPALKALSQIRLSQGSMNVEMLDLARRRVSFEQEIKPHPEPGDALLDWAKLSAALSDSSPHVIDVGSLENRRQNAQFFVSEVKRLTAAAESEAVCALIVLSGPMTFEKGEDLSPIQIAEKPNCHVFYVRYAGFVPRPPGSNTGLQRTAPPLGGRGQGRPVMPAGVVLSDSLERTLKPLEPRLFEVTTPLEFRRALASIVSEITRLGH